MTKPQHSDFQPERVDYSLIITHRLSGLIPSEVAANGDHPLRTGRHGLLALTISFER
jgi:hypothetical protein